MMKVLLIVGTRPEAIKMIPVYAQLKKSKHFKPILLSTGQHREMLQQIFDFFQVKPDMDLRLMQRNQSLPELASRVLKSCQQLFSTTRPDLVMVQGDTTTAMAAALASFYLKIPVAHVEAGLRSYNLQAPFPEEANRKIISSVATFHFAPTPQAIKVLKSEHAAGIYSVTGNTVIDSLMAAKKMVQLNEKIYKECYQNFLLGFDKMILITGHRRESFGEGFRNICEALLTLAKQYPSVSFLYPVHLNPNVRKTVFSMMGKIPNIHLINPVPYGDMVYLMMKSYFILTDSGGIQEEAPSLGKPVLVMRTTTERREAIEAGCSRLVGTSKNKIVKAAVQLLEDSSLYKQMSKVKNPFGKGDSAVRIVKILERRLIK